MTAWYTVAQLLQKDVAYILSQVQNAHKKTIIKHNHRLFITQLFKNVKTKTQIKTS
jgi:hypothetical protein